MLDHTGGVGEEVELGAGECPLLFVFGLEHSVHHRRGRERLVELYSMCPQRGGLIRVRRRCLLLELLLLLVGTI